MEIITEGNTWTQYRYQQIMWNPSPVNTFTSQLPQLGFRNIPEEGMNRLKEPEYQEVYTDTPSLRNKWLHNQT